ncbi:hypothetical protein H8E88_18035 [candidate division KSB1 bacterium]|nr:hypothetical protein [candidate division KSB1 bacterium]
MSASEKEEMIRAEYLRRLIRYKTINESFKKKYKMTNEEFGSKNIVRNRGYSWEIESDSQDWEAALDGIETMLAKLKEIGVESV